jgi:hypothetical protein
MTPEERDARREEMRQRFENLSEEQRRAMRERRFEQGPGPRPGRNRPPRP